MAWSRVGQKKRTASARSGNFNHPLPPRRDAESDRMQEVMRRMAELKIPASDRETYIATLNELLKGD